MLTSVKISVESTCCWAVSSDPVGAPRAVLITRSSWRNQPVSTGYSSTG